MLQIKMMSGEIVNRNREEILVSDWRITSHVTQITGSDWLFTCVRRFKIVTDVIYYFCCSLFYHPSCFQFIVKSSSDTEVCQTSQFPPTLVSCECVSHSCGKFVLQRSARNKTCSVPRAKWAQIPHLTSPVPPHSGALHSCGAAQLHSPCQIPTYNPPIITHLYLISIR